MLEALDFRCQVGLRSHAGRAADCIAWEGRVSFPAYARHDRVVRKNWHNILIIDYEVTLLPILSITSRNQGEAWTLACRDMMQPIVNSTGKAEIMYLWP